tara:strand:+ start:638 stop:772 length:135 start_codon:yes stop_codon:yes gene_type:complete
MMVILNQLTGKTCFIINNEVNDEAALDSIEPQREEQQPKHRCTL